MDKGGRGGGQTIWIVIKFYNIIIKSENVDKGGKKLIHKMGMKRRIFLPLPWRNLGLLTNIPCGILAGCLGSINQGIVLVSLKSLWATPFYMSVVLPLLI